MVWESSKRYLSVLSDLMTQAKIQRCIRELWIDGSLADGTYDEYSDVNLFVKFVPDCTVKEIREWFDGASIVLFKSTEALSMNCRVMGLHLSQTWLDITIYSNEIQRKGRYIDLLSTNYQDLQQHLQTTTPIRNIDHWNEPKIVKQKLDDAIQSFLVGFHSLVVGFKRGDLFVLNSAIEEMRRNLLYANLLLSKRGHIFDKRRIDLYLHQTVKEYIERTYKHSFESDAVHEIIKNLFIALECVLYEYRLLFSTYPERQIQAIKTFVESTLGIEVGENLNQLNLGVYTRDLVDIYDKHRPVPREMKYVLEQIAKRYFLNKDVLELGPGTGRISLSILPYVKTYSAIEQSKAMLDVLKRKIDKVEHPPVTLIHGDMMRLEKLCKKNYDIVLENEALIFALDPIKCVDQILSVLNPGGIFLRLVEFKPKDSLYNKLLDVFYHTAHQLTGEPFVFRWFGVHTKITYYLFKQGFDTVREFFGSYRRQISLGDFVQMFLDRAYPWFSRLSDEVIAASIEAVRKEAKSYGLYSDDDLIEVSIDLMGYLSKKKCDARLFQKI